MSHIPEMNEFYFGVSVRMATAHAPARPATDVKALNEAGKEKKKRTVALSVCTGSDWTHPAILYCFSLIQFRIHSRAKRKVLKQKQKGFWCSRPWCVITAAVIFEVVHKEKGGRERGGKLLAIILCAWSYF